MKIAQTTTVGLFAAVLLVGTTVAACGGDEKESASSSTSSSSATSAASTTTSAPASPAAQGADYSNLLLKPADVDPSFTASDPVRNPNGQPGIGQTLTNAAKGEVLLFAIFVDQSPAGAAQALQGSRSLAVTATAAAWTMTLTSQVPADPGERYTASVASRAATAAAQCRVDIAFYTSGGSWLATVSGAQVSNTTAGWTTVTATGVAPAGAGLAQVAYNFEAASVGHVHYTDCWGLWRGAGGQWAMPGQPILGLTDAPIGNLLSLNAASLENGVGDYSPYANCTLAQHNWGKHGASSLRITSVAAGNASAVLNGDKRVAVTAGDTYTASAFFHSVVSARAASVTVQWYTSANVWISASTGASVTTRTDGTWVQASVTAVAPSTAAYADLIVTIAATGGASEQHTVDCFSLHRGAAGTFALPGTPVVGQSHIATNGAVHLSGTGSPEGVVTAAPGSTWLQTDATTDVKGWIRWVKATGTGNTGWVAGPEADTGKRNLSAVSLSNSWALYVGEFVLQRVGKVVYLTAYFDKSSASADAAYTLPSGFRPTGVGYVGHGQSNVADDVASVFVDPSTGVLSVTRSTVSGTIAYVTATFLTNDAWPSSLLGSPA